MNRTHVFYSRPSYVGGSFPIYSGSRRQRGGTIFGAGNREFLPDATTMNRKQVSSYMDDVANDVLEGKSVTDSMKERAADVLNEGIKRATRMADRAIVNKLNNRRRRPGVISRPAAKRARIVRRPRPRARPRPRLRRRQPVKRLAPRRRRVSMQKFRFGKRRALF